MNNPKIFYRKLDALLARISGKTSGENYLASVFKALEQTFGEGLNIIEGGIFEHRNANFVLIHASENNSWNKKVAVDTPAVQYVYKHGSFIYDDGEMGKSLRNYKDNEYQVPAAIYINSPDRKWLIVFCLKEGWIREEITLFLNAVRTAVNYRLFSDSIGGELQQAVQIQQSLLPHTTPQYEGYEVFGKSVPAELVGGDFYEYFEFEEGDFGISIGDASGHGLPAALLVRDVVIGLRMGLAMEYKLVYTLNQLNKVIQKSTYASNFVSLFICEVEKDGHLFYVNAGHPAPFVISGNESTDLGSTGTVLGFLKDSKLQRSYVHIQRNSVLVMYTDGIVERDNMDEEQFDLDRLKKLVIENQNKSAEEIVDIIYKTAFEFGNSKNWEDDATVVVLKRLK